MKPDQVSGMYIQQAKQLEEQSKYKDAERLYITVNEPDLAIAMYKNKKMWSDMIKLVKTHRPDLAQEAHLVVARVRLAVRLSRILYIFAHTQILVFRNILFCELVCQCDRTTDLSAW